MDWEVAHLTCCLGLVGLRITLVWSTVYPATDWSRTSASSCQEEWILIQQSKVNDFRVIIIEENKYSSITFLCERLSFVLFVCFVSVIYCIYKYFESVECSFCIASCGTFYSPIIKHDCLKMTWINASGLVIKKNRHVFKDLSVIGKNLFPCEVITLGTWLYILKVGWHIATISGKTI